jgi:hypothetical protein
MSKKSRANKEAATVSAKDLELDAVALDAELTAFATMSASAAFGPPEGEKMDRLSPAARAEINTLIPTLQAETLTGNPTEKNRNYLGRDYLIRLAEAIDPRFTIGDLKPTDRGFLRYFVTQPDGSKIRHTIWCGKDEKAGK